MRESCKSGSVGEAAGDRRLYPTNALTTPIREAMEGVGQIRRRRHATSQSCSETYEMPPRRRIVWGVTYA